METAGFESEAIVDEIDVGISNQRSYSGLNREVLRSRITDVPMMNRTPNDVRWACTSQQTYQSLEFITPETKVLAKARAVNNPFLHPSPWKIWIMTSVIGILVGLVAVLLNYSTINFLRFKYKLTLSLLDTHHPILSWAAYTSIDLAFAMLAAVVVFIEPAAAGSGVPEIKCYLNGIRIARAVRWKTFFCKLFGIVCTVNSSLPVGKQGPMIHCACAVAAGVSTGKSSHLRIDTGLLKEFRSDKSKRGFVTCGVAAGIGAAFGAPLAGILFSAEDIGSYWNGELTVRAFLCGSIAAFTYQVVMFPSDGIGTAVRGLIDFGTVNVAYRYIHLPLICLLGCFGGILGALFVRLNMFTIKFRKKYVKPYTWRRFLEVAVISVIVSSTFFGLSVGIFKCSPLPLEESASLKTHGCPSGFFNESMTFFFQEIEGVIRTFFNASHNMQIVTILTFLIPYFFLTLLTCGLAVPGGLFSPLIAIGAALGSLFALVLNLLLPDDSKARPEMYAIVGAGAMMTGTIRDTVSLLVMIMEATGSTALFIPLTFSILCSKVVGDFFTLGLYEMHIKLNRIPLVQNELEDKMLDGVTATRVMRTDFTLIQPTIQCSELLTILYENPHVLLYIVVNERKRMIGTINRRFLLLLVYYRAFITERFLNFNVLIKSSFEGDFLKKHKILDKSNYTPVELVNSFGLSPYMERFPFTVHLDTPLDRVHFIYRTLGLHTIIVVDDDFSPVGTITRTELCHLMPEENLNLQLRETLSTALMSPRKRPEEDD